MIDRPEEMPAAFRAAWMERDASMLASLFAEDADFVNVVGLWWRRRGQIEASHAYGFDRIFANSTLRVGRTRVRRLGDDVAVVHVRFTLEGQRGPDAAELGIRRTVMTFVMSRRDRGWLCVAAQNTDIHERAETMAARSEGLTPTDYREN
ncbi:conserved hypothetical protein [Palleronia marisminoris]|uniref:DUF4440 domain-containing protein n=1 Tax=Palleronia marisminoris TaxID=315423 RepID=A0A1Y5RSC5_9RHOB|nr:SgcJ/EcaC family oxidoreductase [Palleronia marisminoris]SFG54426.1 conserved hypothetical protein [Palleronia marisminoris]SLN23059.1 hypothetical protein PAM7066_00783 [Palleronia marisminoris]